jgi:Mg-chelatase subunit ChlD
MSNKNISKKGDIEELKGTLAKSGTEENKLMSTVDSGETDKNKGKLAEEMMNSSIGGFTPDMIFQNIVNSYKNAKKLYGETIIREITDFEPGYIEKNINIPEFKKELKKNIAANMKNLQSQGVLNSEFVLTDEGMDLAAVELCNSELEKLKIKGFGTKKTKEFDVYGEKDDYKNFDSESRYRDVSVAQTIKNAARRKHSKIKTQDIKIYQRKKTGKIDIVYCLDSSGSMKGNKLGMIKRAGIALAYKTILDRNRVGLLVFNSEIRKVVGLTQNFNQFLYELVRIRAKNQTNISKVIESASELLSQSKNTRHIIILSDAMPNVGEVEQVYESAAIAASKKITISFIGVDLDEKGEKIAERITEIGKGRLYKVKKLKNIDSIILEDYEFARR